MISFHPRPEPNNPTTQSPNPPIHHPPPSFRTVEKTMKEKLNCNDNTSSPTTTIIIITPSGKWGETSGGEMKNKQKNYNYNNNNNYTSNDQEYNKNNKNNSNKILQQTSTFLITRQFSRQTCLSSVTGKETAEG